MHGKDSQKPNPWVEKILRQGFLFDLQPLWGKARVHQQLGIL